MELPHTKTVEEVYEFFKVSEEEGLSVERVTKLRERYGPNGTLLCQYLLTPVKYVSLQSCAA